MCKHIWLYEYTYIVFLATIFTTLTISRELSIKSVQHTPQQAILNFNDNYVLYTGAGQH